MIKLVKGLNNTESEYYKIRSQYPQNDLELAARFIYLNKTSYNGIYRVNRKGEYNVPYGHRSSKDLFDVDNLNSVSLILKDNVEFNSFDFESIKDEIRQGDLIFLDPPYTVAHENNGFVEYNQSIFTWQDQHRLSELLRFISEKKAYFIMTNAKHDSIEELFSPFGKYSVYNRHSTIGGKGAKRQNINEFIFKNF